MDTLEIKEIMDKFRGWADTYQYIARNEITSKIYQLMDNCEVNRIPLHPCDLARYDRIIAIYVDENDILGFVDSEGNYGSLVMLTLKELITLVEHIKYF